MDARNSPKAAWLLAGIVTATAVIAATYRGQALEDADIRANVSTAGDQTSAAVARDADGDYVVVWAGNGDRTDQEDASGIFFQQFDRNGEAAGPETRVNTITAGDQRNPAVAADAAGNFTVVWEDCGTSGGTLCDIKLQRFDTGGAEIGTETIVNATTCGDQSRPAIAMAAGGQFVVTWQSLETESNANPLLACSDNDGYDIAARRFTAAGAALDLVDLDVNTTTAFSQTAPAVAMDADGDLVIVWQGTLAGAGQEIFARAYPFSGNPTDEFRANATAAGNQIEPAVGMSAAGAFVIAWEGADADGSGIFMRRYDAARVAQTAGDEAVNATTAGTQSAAAVAVDASGDFVVAWAGVDSDPFGIFFQRYDAGGVAQDGETAANLTPENDQAFPAVAVDADGDFVIAWESDAQDGAGYGIYTGRFAGPEDVNLAVTVSDGADPATGGTFTYAIQVQNLATAFSGTSSSAVNQAVRSATGVRVVDELPGGVTYASASGAGWTCDDAAGTPVIVTCELADPLQAATSSTVTLTVNAPASDGLLNNSATVSADQYDSAQGNNSDTEETWRCTSGSGSLGFASAFSVGEDGDDAGGNDDSKATVTVTRSGSLCGVATVQASTTTTGMPAPTATTGTDYTPVAAQTVTLGHNQASGTFDVTIVDDALDETDETLRVQIANPTRATLGATTTQLVTIVDNDSKPNVTMSLDGTGSFSESGGTQVVRATLDAPAGQAVQITLAFAAGAGASSGAANRGTGCGTATTPADYSCSGTSISIPAGQTTGTVTLTGAADTRDEDDLEPVAITATCNATCTMTGTAPQLTAQVQDDDAVPTVAFANAGQSVDEDSTPVLPPNAPAESESVTFNVTLSAASDRTVTVDYTFPANSPHDPARATPTDDFTTDLAATLEFQPGQTSKTITLATVPDARDELDEIAVATLSNPGATVALGAQQTHTVTITDNDATPEVRFDPTTETDRSETNRAVVATVTLSAVSNLEVVVPFTVSGTATNPDDHTAQNGSITIPAGDPSATYAFSVKGDQLDEATTETVVLTIGATPTNATRASANFTHTTSIDDDDLPPSVTLAAANSPFSESGGVATVTATLGAVSGRDVTVNLTFLGAANRAASCGTVQNPADYGCSSQSILIAAGTLTGSMTLTGTADTRDEPDLEAVEITATCGGGTCTVSGSAPQVTAQVEDDDALPTLQFTATSASTPEGTTPGFPPGSPEAANTVTLTAQLSAATDRDVTVDFTVSGTAAYDGDYTLTDFNAGTGKGTLTITAGQTSGTITLTTKLDSVDEENETAIVTLSNFVNAAEGANKVHQTTITDNDAAPTVSFDAPSPATFDEEAGDTVTATLRLSAASERPISVPLAVSGSTGAANPQDHNAVASTVVIEPGQLTGTYSYQINDDALDENDETVTLTIGATPTNATRASSGFTHTITIDDSTDPLPTVQIDTASSTATKAENAADLNGTIVVTLSTGSGRAVTVPYTRGGTATEGSDYNVSPAAPHQVVFAAGETSKTITVSVINDSTDEPNTETAIITLSASGQATAGAVTSHTLDITDDDDQPQVSFTTGGATRAEGAGNSVATMQMSRASSQDVTVPFGISGTAAGNDYALLCPDGSGGTVACAGEVIIAAGQTSASITIQVVADDREEGDETLTLTMGTPDKATAQGTTAYTLNITNDDIAGITLAQSGTTDVTEGGAGDSYTLVLTSEPSADVTISLAHGGDVTTPASVTFTAANWDTPQTVNVAAVDDAVAEDNDSDTITHTVTSADTAYNGRAVPDVAVSVTDNDSPDIVLAESDGATSVTEGGASDTYTLVLTSQPTADVVITLTPTQVTLSQTTVTFTSTDWNQVRTITVTAVDDTVDEASPHNGLVTHAIASGDPNYSGETVQNVVPAITDDDDAGVVVAESGGSTSVTEGGADDTYTLVLTSEPTADVTINLSVGPDATVTPTSVTFDATNWQLARTITVTAVDDDLAESTHADLVTHAVTSADTGYDGRAVTDVAVTIADNETPGIVIAESGGSTDVAEGGSGDSYTVVLTSEPTATVTITLADDADVDATPTTLTFTSANWDAPQTVNVAAVDDAFAEGAHTGAISHTVASADADYDGRLVPNVLANVADNENVGVTVTPTSTVVTEGGANDSYTLVLTSQPTADVIITIDSGSQAGPSSTTVTFTPFNWFMPQTVTVIAVDDAIDEGAHGDTFTHVAASSDAGYNGITIDPVAVSITDNDTAGVTVTQSGGTTAIAEGGATDTYTLVLTSEPTASVTIAIGGDADASGSPATVTFTAADWSVPQTVTVTAADDTIAEGAHTGTLTHAASSADANYNGAPIADVAAAITDNDTAGVVVTESGGATAVTEGGATDTYTIVLASQPTADVTITASGDADVGARPSAVTFTPANWSVAQTLTVTAVDDAMAEGTHGGTLTHSATSSDATYQGFAVAGVTATITDDDVASVVVTESGGGTAVVEGGATDSYTIVLTSQPTTDVTISVTGDADVGGSPGSLTFTSANWNIAQTVTVTAVDDLIAEGTHGGTLTHAASGDPGYAGATVASISVSIADDDDANVVLTQSGGTTAVTEGGATDSYTLVLTSQPTADVTITVTGDADVGGSPGSLTFTAANWNVPQAVTVTAVNDALAEGAHSGTLTHATASSDANYQALAIDGVTAAITDNDVASVVVTESGGATAVTEGGATDTYTIVLTSQPTADVTITVTGDADAGGSPGSLTFTSANWNVAQAVTVTAVNDAIAEGSHTAALTHAAASADGGYDGIAVAGITATVSDNDVAGVTITPSGGTTAVAEGGATDTYTIVLNSQPTADVTITASGDADVGAAPGSLTFTSANWNVPQAVTVTAVDDALAEGAHTGTVAHAAASADAGYDGLGIAGVAASIADNDTAGVTVTQSGGTTAVTEGGATDTYTLVLTSQPTADVTVSVAGDTDVGGAPGSLTFTAANWNVAQTVTVTAVNDALAEGAHSGTLAHAATSADAGYNAIPVASVTASITDNDTAGVTVTQSGGTTAVAEGGATDSYTIVLTSEPTADVTVSVTGDADVGGAPASLTFTSANWSVAQTVTVTAVNDALAEGAHSGGLSHAATSADAAYDAIAIAGVTASITDNDSAGVTVTQSGGSTSVTEGGATDSYTIVLNSQPAADVTIGVTGDADVGGAPGSLTFTAANWNVAQTVTVTAVNDALAEGAHSGSLSHAATSGDAAYNAIAIAGVTAAVTDDDTVGVSITQSGGTTAVAEGGATDSYTIALTSQPAADVTIGVTGDADVGGTPGSLTFTSANWDVPQTVTVAAVEDAIAEGAHGGTLSHAATSADAAYNGIAIASVTATVADNDAAGVSVTQSGGSTAVAEGGATDSYTLVLTSQPVADVTIAVNGDADVGGAPASLTFTPVNWNVAQTVTVTAVNDTLAEGAHSGSLTHAATSGDAVYNGIAIASVNATVADNDTAGVTVTQSGGSTDVVEGGANDTITVVLNSQPVANVTVTLAPDAQLGVAPAVLTFTAANWNVPQTVTVAAVDDGQVENAHTGALGGTVASSDAAYNGTSLATITVVISDNDRRGGGGAFSWSALLMLLGLAGWRQRRRSPAGA